MAEGAAIGGRANLFQEVEDDLARGQTEAGQPVPTLPTGQLPDGDLVDRMLAREEEHEQKVPQMLKPLPFGLESFRPVSPDALAEGLVQAYRRTGQQTPDQAAEIARLSRQTALPEAFVQANLAEVKDIAAYPDPDVADLVQRHPGTALFLANPTNMALAKDDVANLRKLEDSLNNLWPDVQRVHAARETAPWTAWDRFWQKNRPVDDRTGLAWLMTAPGQAWEASAQQDAESNVYSDMLFQGQTPELMAQAKAFKDQAVNMPGVSGYGEQILVGGTAQTRQLIDLASNPMIGSMVGYVGGRAAGAALRLPSPVQQQMGLQGAKIGGGIGAFKAMFNLEGGGALKEYMEYKDLNTGKPIDFSVARGAAIVTGIANAGIEAAEFAVLWKMLGIPKAVGVVTEAVKRSLVKEAVVTGLNLPSTRALLAQIGARGVGGWLLESGQEGVQEIITAYMGELAKAIHNREPGQYTPQESTAQIGQRVWDTMVDASASFVPLVGLSSLIGGYRSTVALNKARLVEAKLQEFKKTLDEQRLAQRSPEAVEAAVRSMTGTPEGEAAPPLYINARAFNGYFQQSDSMDEAMRVLEVMGILPEEYEQAVSLNADLALPTDKVASTLAQTKHWDHLVGDLKVNAFDISAREALSIDQEVEQVRIQELAKAYDEAQVPREEIDRLAGELLATGRVTKAQAVRTAALFGNLSRTLTQNGKETPRQWFERVKPRIVTDTVEAFKRRWESLVGPQAPLLQHDDAALAGIDLNNRDTVAEALRLWSDLGVESPYFLKWFSGSQVVDEQGRPLVVYHGTRAGGIDSFDIAKSLDIGMHFGTSQQANKAPGMKGRSPAGKSIYPVYLSLKNPLEIDYDPIAWNPEELAKNAFSGILSEELQSKLTQDAYDAYNKARQDLTDAGHKPGEAPAKEWDRVRSERMAPVYAELRKALTDAGYDGIIYPNRMEGKGKSYVIFDSSQAKSVYNRGTFEGGDNRILYQTVESTGDTPQERLAYFAHSKVRDAAGTLKVMFHGANRADRIGDRFQKSRASAGPMAFFTDSAEIASSYAKGKQDTSLEVDDLARFFVIRGAKTLEIAWARTPYAERARIREMAHRIGLDEETSEVSIIPRDGDKNAGLAGREHFEYELQRARGNAYKALFEMWVASGAIFGEERKFLDVLRLAGVEDAVYNDPYAEYPGVFPVYLNITNPLDTAAISKEVVAELERSGKGVPAKYPDAALSWDKSNVSGARWLELLHQDLSEGTTLAWTVIPDFVTAALKSLGYDGIKDTGGKLGGERHEVWIPFEENQVKSVFNQNPTSDPRLLFQAEAEEPRQTWFSSRLRNALADTRRLAASAVRDEKQQKQPAYVIRQDKGRGLTEKIMQSLKSMQVPQEEIFWSGLEDYLAEVEAQAKAEGRPATVTRQDLLDVVDRFTSSFEDIILLSDEARLLDVERNFNDLIRQESAARNNGVVSPTAENLVARGELTTTDVDALFGENGIGQRLYTQARAQVDQQPAGTDNRVLPNLHDIDANENAEPAMPGDLSRMAEYYSDIYMDSARQRLTEEVLETEEVQQVEDTTRNQLEQEASDEAQRIREDFAQELEALYDDLEDVSLEQARLYQEELDAVREIGIYSHTAEDFKLLSALFGKDVLAEVEQRVQDQMESYDMTPRNIEKRVAAAVQDFINNNVTEREVEDYAREEAFQMLDDRNPYFYPSLLNDEPERFGVWVLDSAGDGTEYAIGTADGQIYETTFSADEALVLLQRRNGEAAEIEYTRPSRTKWDAHKFEGGNNYREHLVRFDLGQDAERHFKNDHFSGVADDIFGHNRIEDRVDVHGVPGLHAIEIQSDAAQGAEKRGVYTPAALDAARVELDDLNRWFVQWVMDRPGGESSFMADMTKAAEAVVLRNPDVLRAFQAAMNDKTMPDLRENREKGIYADDFAAFVETLPPEVAEKIMRARWLKREISVLDAEEPHPDQAVPAMPFLTAPENLLVKRLIHYAVANGYHTLFVSTAAHHTKRWGTPLLAWKTVTEYAPPEGLDQIIEQQSKKFAAAQENVRTHPVPNQADLALVQALPHLVDALEKLRTGPDISAERAEIQSLQDVAQGRMDALAQRIVVNGEEQRNLSGNLTNALVPLVFEIMPPEMRDSSDSAAHRASLEIHNHLESYCTGTTTLPDYISGRLSPDLQARLDDIRAEYQYGRRASEASENDLYRQRHAVDLEVRTYGNLLLHLDNWLRRAQVPGFYVSGTVQHKGVVFHEGRLVNLEEMQQQHAEEMRTRYNSRDTAWEPFTDRSRLRAIVRGAVMNQNFSNHRYDQKIEAYTDRVLAMMKEQPNGHFAVRDAGFREAYDRRIKNLLQKIAKSWGGELGMSAITETRQRTMRFEPNEPDFVPSLAHAAQFLDELVADGLLNAAGRDHALHAFSVGDGGHVESMWRDVARVISQASLENYSYLLGGRMVEGHATVPVYKLALDEQGGLAPEQAAKVRRLVLEDRLPLYQDKGTVTRGAVHWEQGQTIISVFEKGNVSTVPHELGHLYLTELERLVAAGEATEQQERDLKIVREWLHEEGEVISDEGQEKFANGFLTYLREGKAPTEHLAETFALFKRWLMALYKAVRGSGVSINPKIRAVYDRMLATQEELDGVRHKYGLQPIFEDEPGLEGVFTARELADYEQLAGRASLAADIEMQKYHESERRKYRRHLVEQFDESLKHNMAWRLKSYLLYSVDPLGEHSSSTKPVRGKNGRIIAGQFGLSYDDAVYHWGKEGLEGVQLGLVRKEGEPLDMLMMRWGLDSPDIVYGALHFNAKKLREDYVASGLAQFDAEWRQEGTPWANELVERRMDAEARMLRRLTKDFVPASLEGIKRLVNRKVESMTVAQLQAGFENIKAAVAKIGQEIGARRFLLRAALAHEYDTAAKEQREVNREKLRTLREQWAQDVAEANERRRVALAEIRERSKAREELAKLKNLSKAIFNSKLMDWDYREQAMAIVQRFGLGTPTMAPAVPFAMPPLLQFVQERGIGPDAMAEIPSWLFSEPRSGFRSVRAMTVAQMRDLRNALLFLQHRGQTERKMLGLAEDVAVATVAERSVKTMEALKKGPRMLSERDREAHKSLVKARGLVAELGMVRYWADAADGFTNHGPDSVAGNTTKYLVYPFDLAESGKQDALRKLGEKLDAIFAPFRENDKGTVFPIQGVPLLPEVAQEWGGMWDRQKVLMVALNMGNEGNIRALMAGYNWTYDQLRAITARLTADEWRMVQKIWDSIDELYPEIDRVHRIINGTPLIKVQPLALDSPAGHLRGGYFPLIFDHRLSDKAAFLGGLDKLMNEVEAGAYADEIQHQTAVFRKSNPVNGFTKGRKGSSLPPLLSLKVLSHHLNTSLHYIHYGTALRNAYKIVAVPEFRTAWVRAFGEDSYMELGNWLRRQARPGLVMSGKFDKMFERMRVLGSIQALGLSMQTALTQLSSIPMSWQEIGFKAFMKGAAIMAEHGSNAWAACAELSPYMADRRHNLDSTMHDLVMRLELEKHQIKLLARMGVNLTTKDYQDFMYSWLQTGDALVAYPTWYGAYDQALNEKGLTPAEAVLYADEKLKRAQASGGLVDAPTFLRTAGAARLFSMFMSFSLNLLNNQVYFIRGWREGMISSRDFSRHVLLSWALPPLLSSCLIAWCRGEPWPQFRDLFFGLFGYLLSGLPLLREVARSIEYGGRVGGSAAMKPLEDIGKFVARAAGLLDDKDRDGEFLMAVQSLVDLIGYGIGIPTRPIWRAVQGVHDMSEGKTINPMRLFFRAPKEEK